MLSHRDDVAWHEPEGNGKLHGTTGVECTGAHFDRAVASTC